MARHRLIRDERRSGAFVVESTESGMSLAEEALRPVHGCRRRVTAESGGVPVPAGGGLSFEGTMSEADRKTHGQNIGFS